ncbi:MAG: hypothetical protein ACI9DC_005593, partial [Gammaproteobacteria bacterium]
MTTVCEAFGLPRSTPKYRQSAAKRIAAERVELNAMVKAVHTVSNGSAGARSIAHIVTRQGMPLSRYRATGFMKHHETPGFSEQPDVLTSLQKGYPASPGDPEHIEPGLHAEAPQSS